MLVMLLCRFRCGCGGADARERRNRKGGREEETKREGEKRRKKEKEGRRVRQCRAGGPAAGQKQRGCSSDARSVLAALDAYSLLRSSLLRPLLLLLPSNAALLLLMLWPSPSVHEQRARRVRSTAAWRARMGKSGGTHPRSCKKRWHPSVQYSSRCGSLLRSQLNSSFILH